MRAFACLMQPARVASTLSDDLGASNACLIPHWGPLNYIRLALHQREIEDPLFGGESRPTIEQITRKPKNDANTSWYSYEAEAKNVTVHQKFRKLAAWMSVGVHRLSRQYIE